MSNCSKETAYFAGLFKVLGDPSRLTIFLRLAACCTVDNSCEANTGWRECIGEISKDLNLAPSTVSHHIKKLLDSGLIQTKRQGKRITCWIDPKTLKSLQDFITVLE
jgi:ArsR family transcriptional regulator, arsenate/arsenite/antimonite-responsive transcriptional repressor